MNKKVISLVLALVMVLGTFTSVFATGKTEEPAKKEAKVEETKKEAPKDGEKVDKVVGKDNKIQYIVDKKFVQGYEDGSMGYDKNITRAEITRLLVLANGNEDLAKSLQGSMKLYTDVDTKHWANGVISVGTTRPSDANKIAMLAGYPDKSFKPDQNVTYAELAKMLVVLVKKDLTEDMVKNAKWATSWMLWAKELGILEDIDVKDSNAFATRADAFTMVYNALYAMKYFKRTAANQTMGIVSQLKNNELTLNQGEKAKTFKLTNSAVYITKTAGTLDVNARTSDHSDAAIRGLNKLVLASAINNPEFYYGALVRVIADKEGNVTHVVELGNPADLALGNAADNARHDSLTANVIKDNYRWVDVADNTVETSRFRTLYSNLPSIASVAAKINYKNGDAKSIDFAEGVYVRKPENETGSERYENNFKPAVKGNTKLNVKLTAKTRYFVADQAQNQLTEVNNVDEAIRILGNTSASNWFFDVYAGFNTIGGIKNYKTAANTAVEGYNEATVVVFNAVQKSNNNAQVVRVVNETNSKYDLAFEDTDGKIINKNVAEYRGYFPFNVGPGHDSAKLDVIEYAYNNVSGISVKCLIRHSDTDVYPIVRVADVDGRRIKVVDKYNDYAYLLLASEADVFLNGQIKEGALIQFRTENGNVLTKDVNANNVVSVVSVMPARYDAGMKGALAGVVQHNQYNQSFADTPMLIDFIKYGNTDYDKVMLKNLRGLDGSRRSFDLIVMNQTESNALQAFLKANPTYNSGIRFKLRHFDAPAHYEAYDVEVLVDKNWVPVRGNAPVAEKSLVEQYKEAIKKTLPIKEVNCEKGNVKSSIALLAEIDGIKAKFGALTDELEWNKLPEAERNAYEKQYEAFKKLVEEAKENNEALAKAVKTLKALEADDLKVKLAADKSNNNKADIAAAIAEFVSGKVNVEKDENKKVKEFKPEVTVTVNRTESPVTATIVLKSNKCTETVELDFAVSADAQAQG